MYSEVVETKGQYRASIILDDNAEMPDWDGMYPTLQVGSNDATPLLGDNAEDFAPILRHMLENNPTPLQTFERYLRVFHGTTKFVTHNIGRSREYGYVAFDTAKWRKTHGIEAAQIKDENLLADVIAWAEGDCWGVRVEKLVKWTTDDDDEIEEQETEDWVELETVWGFYGDEYAREEAHDSLIQYGE